MAAAWALRRHATKAPPMSTAATTQTVATMLLCAVDVMVPEPPEPLDEAAATVSAAARATLGRGVGAATGAIVGAAIGAAVGAGAGLAVGLPGLGEGGGVGFGVGGGGVGMRVGEDTGPIDGATFGSVGIAGVSNVWTGAPFS